MSAHKRQQLVAKLRKAGNRIKASRVAAAFCLISASAAVSPAQPCVKPVVLPVEQAQEPNSIETVNNSNADDNNQMREASEAVVEDLDEVSDEEDVGQVLADEDGEDEEDEEANGSSFTYLPATLLNSNFMSDPLERKPPVFFGRHLMVEMAKPAHYWLNRYEALYDSYVYTPVPDNDYEDDGNEVANDNDDNNDNDNNDNDDNDSVLSNASHHGTECNDGASDLDYYVRSGVDSAATNFNSSRYSKSNANSSNTGSTGSLKTNYSQDGDNNDNDDDAASLTSLQRRLTNSRRIFNLMERLCLTDEARRSLYQFEYKFAIQHHFFEPADQN